MKRLWILAALVWALCFGPAGAEAPEMRIDISGEILLPGQPAVVSVTAPEDGVCAIRVLDGDGRQVSAVSLARPVSAGYNAMYWNGTFEGAAAPEGTWRLVMEMNGRTAETTVTIGRMIPYVIGASLSEDRIAAGKNVTVSGYMTEAGTLRVTLRGNGAEETEYRLPVESGDSEAVFPAAAAPGAYEAELVLYRDDGTASIPVRLALTITEPETPFSPAGTGTEARRDYTLNGWTVPMDITDEAAVWQALTAEVTVVDDRRSSDQRRQTVIRKEPDRASEGVGMVTMLSQGVHVLERGEEWSLVECYSSSFSESAILNWNALVRGYVPTAYLRTVTPDPHMGLVVDKLTQRMYVFVDGELYSTLLVSTGLVNERQPYNETRAGEFLLVSRVGGFESDDLYCPLGIRFNAGDLLHEVPYVKRSTDYSRTEPKLGSKASHGCIRVQRKLNPEGVNMQWLWGHYRENTKILVWEDWQGRQIPVPEDDTVFYVNLRKNTYYHRSAKCGDLGIRNPQTMTYAEISGDAGRRLLPCPYCGPTPKKAALEEINAAYAAGGDHDPVMTKAREDCPREFRPKSKEK